MSDILSAALLGISGLILSGSLYARMVRRIRRTIGAMEDDATLGRWARHMNITVITVTGTEFTTNLAELRTAHASDFRTWNVPVSVTLWHSAYDPAEILGKDPDA